MKDAGEWCDVLWKKGGCGGLSGVVETNFGGSADSAGNTRLTLLEQGQI